MKRALLTLVAILAIAGLGAYLFREQLMLAAIASQIAPAHDFDPALAPTAPDYTADSAWAALPSIQDPSDESPDDIPRATADVGVFFLHPTSFFGKGNWNQPQDHAGANWITDNRVLRHQASTFNACCEVFAPRYRQATFYAYLDEDGNGEQALDLAYSDVLAAFEAFVERNGDRPFILAGHSQGSQHGARLLRERIKGSPEQAHMVAAYLVGFALDASDMGNVPICDAPTDTGCAIGWNAVDGDRAGLNPDGRAIVCVNPLSWRHNDEHVDNTQNLGGIGYPSYNEVAEGEDVTAMDVEAQVADARCTGGNLQVSDLRSEAFPARMLGGSMHVYDYSLYYLNIRENALQRVAAFQAAQRYPR
ncbi:MAG: DUF3089 domain-containing protein [Halioglobus sp.]|nr:DUF3089 domain-containing protein [Halioglobus sp.]